MKKIIPLLMLVILFTINLNAQWSSDPATNLRISNMAGDQAIPKVAFCPNGDVYIAYMSSESGNYNVRLQRLDNQGNKLWAADGLLVSSHPSMTWLTDWDMTVDHDNHAILTWQDIRSAGNNNTVAYRIAPDGSFVWGADGIMLSISTAFDVAPKTTVTAANNAVFAWQSDNVIIMQKISPTGSLLWGASGITLSSANRYSWPQLIPVGSDDIIMKFYEDSGPTWAPTRKVYAQRFNANGQAVWASNATISDAGTITAWTQILPMINDGSDGFYITWHDNRFSGTISSAWVQHISSSGQVLFSANGTLLSNEDSFNQFYPQLAKPTNDPNVYIYWNEVNGDQNQWGIYGQKVDASGNTLWGNHGKVIFPVSSQALLPQTAMAVENDVVLVYESYFNGTETSLKATRLNSEGDFVWTPQEALISSVQSNKVHLDVSQFDGNQWILSWEDDRTGDVEIYAQNLQPTGELGPVVSQGTITGTVSIENNLADVTEVTISAGSYMVHPASDGSYTLNIAPGTYVLTASHPYTVTQSIPNVVVETGSMLVNNFTLLMQRTDLHCYAYDQYGWLMPDVAINATGPENTYSGTTDGIVPLTFANVPFGIYNGIGQRDDPQADPVLSDTIIDATNSDLVFIFIVAGLDEINAKQSMTIAPNPINENSSLFINSKTEGLHQVKLFADNGKQISTLKNIILINGENSLKLTNLIDTSKLKQGIYFLQLEKDSQSSIIKFIVIE